MTSVKSTRLQPLPLPSWLSRAAWPFATFGIEADGSLLAVSEAGSGPTLLFEHVGAWSFIWRDLVRQLAPDFRCVFFDAPGSGLSGKKPGAPATLNAACHAVEAVISTLDLRDITLVAHDLGGPAAFGAAGGLSSRIRGLVAMNSFGWYPEGVALRGMLALMGSGLMRGIDAATGFIPRISASSFGVGRHYDEDSRRAFLAGMGQGGRRAFHEYMHDAFRCDELYRQVTRSLTGPLAGLPLLTIFGERNDPFGFQREWKRLFPEARQVVVKRGNHFPMCDAPEFTANAIRSWFREQAARAA